MSRIRWFLADVETTGTSPDDKVCEVAWHEIDEAFNTLNSGYSLINPQRHIPHGASAVNGIVDSMVRDAPTLDEYMREFEYPLLGADVIMVAHNAAFDFRYLSPYMDDNAKTLCTLRCARVIYPDADNHKQGTLAYYLGLNLDREKAHSADGDLDVLLQLVQRMCADLDCTISDLLKVQDMPRKIEKMPFGKHKGMSLKSLPKEYVTWLLKLDNLDADLRAALRS